MATKTTPSSSLEKSSLSLANATAVAIDKDKNSLQAFRWAVDNLTSNNPVVVLIHVRQRSIQSRSVYMTEGYAEGSGYDDKDDAEMHLLFPPLRPYCARKRVQAVEVVLEDTEVARALLDFINRNAIGSIIVGSSNKSALTRKFRQQDVPGSLMKLAPPYCSVYVIAKGKVVSSRSAQRSILGATLSQSSTPMIAAGQEDGDRGQSGMVTIRTGVSLARGKESGRELAGPPLPEKGDRTRAGSVSMESIDIAYAAPKSSYSLASDESDVYSRISLGSIENSASDMDLMNSPKTPTSDQSVPSSAMHKDMEAEMKRLRLELKQTMDMYSTACKEALSAKKKAEEAQKLAEMEMHKRKQAELKAKKEAEEKKRALSALAQNDVRYRRYTIEEIENATENFAESNKIGEGGYGPVYRGMLDNTPVAIKVLRSNAAQGKRQFQQEIEVLSSMRHPNLVLLLGACPEYGCLVYEYMDFGSLEDRLLQKNQTTPLSWQIRFKIAAEIATALLFLHQAKPEPLVHRDLKPANILLDHNYLSKISDVGLARLVPPSVADSVTQYHLTSAAGTFCYIDPEYQQSGKLTTRSDLYSLGILYLQIITSLPPIGIAHRVIKAIEKGNFAAVLDKAVTDWPVEEALKFAKLALQCAELRKRDRPSLAGVLVPELNRLRKLGETGHRPPIPRPVPAATSRAKEQKEPERRPANEGERDSDDNDSS